MRSISNEGVIGYNRADSRPVFQRCIAGHIPKNGSRDDNPVAGDTQPTSQWPFFVGSASLSGQAGIGAAHSDEDQMVKSHIVACHVERHDRPCRLRRADRETQHRATSFVYEAGWVAGL